MKRPKLSREDNPERYKAIEDLSAKVLLAVQEFLSHRDFTRESRLDALNALAWSVASMCIGVREVDPFQLYDWFDDTLFEAVTDMDKMKQEQQHEQAQRTKSPRTI